MRQNDKSRVPRLYLPHLGYDNPGPHFLTAHIGGRGSFDGWKNRYRHNNLFLSLIHPSGYGILPNLLPLHKIGFWNFIPYPSSWGCLQSQNETLGMMVAQNPLRVIYHHPGHPLPLIPPSYGMAYPYRPSPIFLGAT